MRQPERAIFLGLMMPSILLQALSWVLGTAALQSRGGSGKASAIAAGSTSGLFPVKIRPELAFAFILG